MVTSLPYNIVAEEPGHAMAKYLSALDDQNPRRVILALGDLQDAEWSGPDLDQYRAAFRHTKTAAWATAARAGQPREAGLQSLWVHVENLLLGNRPRSVPWSIINDINGALRDSDDTVARVWAGALQDELDRGARISSTQQRELLDLDKYAQENDIDMVDSPWFEIILGTQSGDLVLPPEPEDLCAWCIAHNVDEVEQTGSAIDG